ncbi:hypothetical protein MJO29_011549 [Puccinia striiformis f. sp. tritici]|nr:hypothetical protein MJO29_011549 [Puccinia striiformis f. sp. tritici]
MSHSAESISFSVVILQQTLLVLILSLTQRLVQLINSRY